MRGEKDEENKVVSPMFPRLHVNDTERGGPRAPPRNKMALYEQLSVPSQQRFSSRSASMLPLPSPSSSTHGGNGRERTQFTPLCSSPAPSYSTEKPQPQPQPRSYCSTGANLGSMVANHESTKPTIRPLQPIAKCHSFHPPNFPNFRNLSVKKHSGYDPHSDLVSRCNDTEQSKDGGEKQFPLFGASLDPNLRQNVRNQSGDSHIDRQISIPSAGDKVLADSPPTLSAKDRNSGSLNRSHESLIQNHHRNLLDAVSKRRGTDARMFQEFVALRDRTKTILLEEAPNEASEKCSRPAAEKQNDISDSSMVDSVSVLDISPDDVVGVIGEKHFWKARKAIVNQQRVFAVQVFELHRLIKVQRLIAESPDLLLEQTLPKGSLAKKLSSESILEPSPGIARPRNNDTECGAESSLPKLPLPRVDDETSKGLSSHRPFYGPYTGTQPPQPIAPIPKPSPWSQWLVPVMSPSEGFVYKPYTGPGPPNGGLMTPVYGNYDPMNAGFGILPGTSPLGQAYFPPYGMPVMNPSASGSAVEQVSPFSKAQPEGHEDQESNVDINLAMSSQMSRAISCRVKKQASKESEVQGSTASSPSSRINGEALTLFPLASDLNASEPPAKVIKVVPHNPRSATESAARILQFIQEERKQFD